MSVKVAINGFGRIGRLVVRAAIQQNMDVEFVAINDKNPEVLAHLFKYDSVHGVFPGEVTASENAIVIDGKTIPFYTHFNLDELIDAWKDLDIDVLVESTGVYTKRAQLERLHNETKANYVLLSRPMGDADITMVYGVNHENFDPENHKIVSNASCTTNCLAPPVHVLHKEWGIKRGMMTTVHAFTNDQRILDAPHSDLRRARTASMSMIPTTTGAAKAIGLVIPELKGKFDGGAVRVPTPDVSLVDAVIELNEEVTTEQVNAAMQKYAEGPLKGVLRYMPEPLVSIDLTGSYHSSVYDVAASLVLGGKGNMVKVMSWYDNEMGYSARMVDVIMYMMSKTN